MAKKGKFSQPRDVQEQAPETVPTPPAGSAAPKKRKHRKPNRNLTLIFYTLYVLMILSFAAGIFFHARWLEEQLVLYEESRPEVAVELIFEEHFAQPDWGKLYDLAGVAQTEYEGKDTFVAYMTEKVAGQSITWEKIPLIRGTHTYLLTAGEQELGYFTLENTAPYGDFPRWALGDVVLYVSRTQSATVLAPRGYQVSVNGAALEEIHVTRRIRQSCEEETVTWYCHQITGLLMEPEITVTDREGASLSVIYDPISGMYLAEPEGLRYDADARIREEVRISFLYGDTVLFTNFHDPDTPSLLAPVVSPPEGQVFAGWFRKDLDESGEISFALVFTPDENGNITLPGGTELEPVTLYALFEHTNTTDGGTE